MSSSRARSSAWVALACLASFAAAGCAASSSTPAPRTNHDALYRNAVGDGTYEIDPNTAALARRGPTPFPPKKPAAEAEKPCEHVWEFMDRATHSYIDPHSGLPALCTPRYCPKCGLVIHDCQNPRGR
jgi:hypothetical protein